ncbi:Type I transmembrane sorting receptor [Tulasnella sp. 403]|nr:Type I transmembrane sorting receptor [Tulasnella sp. 403]
MLRLILLPALVTLLGDVLALPTEQPRGPVVIPLSNNRRSLKQSGNSFDLAAARRQVEYINWKYGEKRAQGVADGHPQDSTVHSGNFVARAGSAYQTQSVGSFSLSPYDPVLIVLLRERKVYYGQISVGTPPQNFTAIIDTSTSDLYVPTSLCSSSCPGPKFVATQSSSFQDTSQPFTFNATSDISVSGTIASDVVSIGTLTVNGQHFGAITKAVGLPPNWPISTALIGLGFQSASVPGLGSWFSSLVQGGQLLGNLFSLYLGAEGPSGSELCLGCINSKKYTGNLAYYPVDVAATAGAAYIWNIRSSGLSYGGNTPTGTWSALFDTYLVFNSVPATVAQTFYSQIPGAAHFMGNGSSDNPNLYTYPCSATLDTIAFHFNSTAYPINPANFNLGPSTNGSSLCVGSIIGADRASSGIPVGVLGTSFLRSWYTIYDAGGLQIGLAQAVPS